MGFGKGLGKVVGTVGGGLIGGAVKVTGKAVGTKFDKTGAWMEEIGDGVKGASVNALSNAGQFIDGTVHTAVGYVKDDEVHKEQGKADLKQSVGNTAKGIGSTIKYTASGVSESYKGFRNGDNEQALNGLKNVGKVVAVSALAIGVLDVIGGTEDVSAAELSTDTSTTTDVATDPSTTDGPIQHIETINDDLAGTVHPETGVPFESKVVALPDGTSVEGVFPVFSSDYSAHLAQVDYLESDHVQFALANQQLDIAILENPSLADEIGLTNTDINRLALGETPEGFTWHHSENPGELQLVDSEIHGQTAHDGGRMLWGGGTDNR
ncbi:MAG: HNH endonuclease [Kurthia sp.]|nr:HNH endonuclease [Candidatus Kurthia equi]